MRGAITHSHSSRIWRTEVCRKRSRQHSTQYPKILQSQSTTISSYLFWCLAFLLVYHGLALAWDSCERYLAPSQPLADVSARGYCRLLIGSHGRRMVNNHGSRGDVSIRKRSVTRMKGGLRRVSKREGGSRTKKDQSGGGRIVRRLSRQEPGFYYRHIDPRNKNKRSSRHNAFGLGVKEGKKEEFVICRIIAGEDKAPLREEGGRMLKIIVAFRSCSLLLLLLRRS